MHLYIHTYVYMYVCIYIHINACIIANIGMYTYMYIYTYTCMYCDITDVYYSHLQATISRLLNNHMSLLQNIVSFIGLYCKRDL